MVLWNKNDQMAQIKVNFELEIVEAGFPPISHETLNGILLPNGLVKIDNTPFFVEEIAVGYVVECVTDGINSNHSFLNLVEKSDHEARSIMFIDSSIEEEIYQFLKKAGCYCEYGEFSDFNMLAVDIAGDVNSDCIYAFLDEFEALEKLSYAELCL